MKVDVLLATCRPDAPLLAEQVASIRAQDGVEARLAMREDAAGAGAAANFSALLADSRADYAAFSDQDDVWMPNKLVRLLECVKSVEASVGKSTPVLAFSDAIVTDAALKPLAGTSLSRQRVDVARGLALPRLLMQNFIAGNTMLFNAALRERAGAIPRGALMHDSWFALVAAAFGRIAFVDEPLLYYRQHGANALGETRADAAHFLRRAREGAAAFRARLALASRQAQAFEARFGADALPECARALARLGEMGWARRRAAIVSNGLFKHGLARNLALMLLA